MKKTNNDKSLWHSNFRFWHYSDIRHPKSAIAYPLSILAFFTLFSTILAAQPIYKTYPNTTGGTAIGEYNNGENYLINTCKGNQATYLWTDGQGNLLNSESDFAGSCGQYRVDANTYIKADTVGTEPNRDIRFRKIARNGAVILEKIYSQALDNFGQFVSPTKDGGFIIAGNTQVTTDTLYRVQLTKIDVNGNLQWHKTVNVPTLFYSNARINNPTSCYDVRTAKTIYIKEVGQTSDGGFYLTYYWTDVTAPCGFGYRNGEFIIRTDATGDFMWQKGQNTSEIFGGIAYKILPNDNGSLYVLDSRVGGAHHITTFFTYYFRKIAANGDTLWTFSGQRNPNQIEGQVNIMHAFSLMPDNNILAHTTETVVKYAPVVEHTVIKLNALTGRFIDSFNVNIPSSKAIILTKDNGFALVGGIGNNGINGDTATFFYKNKFSTPTNLPDLTLANLTLPTSPIYENQLLKWKIDIKNIGTGNAPSNFTVKTYVSTDNVLSADDRLYSTIPTGNFNAGFSVLQVSDSTTTPRIIPAGQYYLIAKADADNQVIESNENNNILVSATKFAVIPALKPDLVITAIQVDLVPNPTFSSEYIATAKVTFKNIGAAPASSNVVATVPNIIWLSTKANDTLSNSTYASLIFGSPSNLAVGASQTVTTQVFGVPAIHCSTTLYWNAQANLDAGGGQFIVESNYSNNFFGGVRLACPTTTPPQYCASKGVAPWEYAIGNVKLGALNITSDKFKDINTLGYSDYTNLGTTIVKGQTYPLSITPLLSWIGNLPNVYCRVWIDFNQNKTFEANELVLEKTNANPLTVNFLVPTTATIGTTRVRVSLKFGSYPTACETFDKGEVEDYLVDIQSGNDPCANDVTPPVFTNCRDTIFKFSGGNTHTGTYTVLNPIATDNCSTPTVTSDVGATVDFNTNSFRSFIINFTAKDAKNNTATCQQFVTLQDTCIQRYYFFIPQDTIIYVDANATCGNFKWTFPTLIGSCNIFCLKGPCYASLISVVPAIQFESSTSPSVCFPIGTTTITHGYDGVEKSFKVTVVRRTTSANDLALTLTATPSVYRQYTTQNFKITAKNSGATAFSTVKIKFTRPNLTVNGGTKVASIGTFQDFCAGGIECSEWTIPTLAAGATATLDIPVYVLNPTGGITATATLLSSNPVDNNTANNTASVTINSANAPIIQTPNQLAAIAKPTQLIPVIIQKIAPTITENFIVVELESIINKTIDFEISNSLGSVVSTEKIVVEKGTNKFHFQVENLPKGMYFIQTSVGKGRNVPMKFVKY
jgi:hypothetical protein